MTFSVVGRDGDAVGVAVASKFLAAGAMVPAAAAGAGAVATQSYANLELKSRGLALLAEGVPAAAVLDRFFADDPQREERQAGAVDARGGAATFTGARCQPWAGGTARTDVAAQGNMLAGPEVVDAMLAAWDAGAGTPLPRRLLAALSAGQDAGGDPRGKQAAALLVVAPGAGYGGLSDVQVDLRVDDHPEPIGELDRMLDLHDLHFGASPEESLLPLDDVAAEVAPLLAAQGYASGDVARDLYDWMGRENYEMRWHDGRVDPVVLAELRRTA